MSSSISNASNYTKKDPIDHILDRSDMYCGSKTSKKMIEYVAEPDGKGFKIVRKEIKCSPALLRIFIEALSNSIDNVLRSKDTETPCTKIKITIDEETGRTTIWNDGQVVPIVKNEKEKCYIHSMIFGQLLTGSNYEDSEERYTSGRNGLGVKCTNVFSKEFIISGLDPVNKKKLTQVWTNNMKSTEGAKVRKTKKDKGYTEVSYIPDFERFKLSGYTADIISLYTRYIIDGAMMCNSVKVFLNGKLLGVNNLSSYSKLYMTSDEFKNEIISLSAGNSEIVITASEVKEYQEVSFVNGVFTKLGGVHVEAWLEAVFRPLLAKFNKKGKPQINIRDIKQFFRVFVIANVDKPEFDSQEKHRLESPNIKVTVTKQFVNKIFKWKICENIKDIIKGKEMVVMKKTERKKKGFVKIDGLDPANNAGTKLSHECTLILCEGLSAKTYAVAGIEKGVYGKSGRDFFGVMALRGKVLNCRNASPSAIAKNREIGDLIKALGISHGVDYTKDKNYKNLRYGKIMILTDADVDGIHIEGLIINTFHYLFPTVMERGSPFIVSMKTPIVRVFQKPNDLLFYDERRFREFSAKQTKKINSKYYKGLGTTKTEDVPDTFGEKMIEFVNDTNCDENINKVFNKKHSNKRKIWMSNYDKSVSISLDDVEKFYKMNVTDFINGEMIKFSINDCKRSIPSCVDGLKESQRKILYCVKKRNLRYSGKSLKVAQLGGYVAEHSNYHHGEQNLYDTITKMANEFPGSNNIPLLYRDGQFGSRTYGGKDAASARYIFTKMEKLTNLIFRPEDDCLLERNIDDGDMVEPKFYIPIIPMILVNGCSAGIGTGWSCNVPNFNPKEIIKLIKNWLNDKDISKSEMKPWYRGFTGEIEKKEDGKYTTYGMIESTKKKLTYKITELPIGMWTDNFKNKLEEHLENKKIKSMSNYSTPKKVDITVKECENSFVLNKDTLKMYSHLNINNMVLFTEEEKLNKFSTPVEILVNFCSIRLKYYVMRKENLLNELRHQLNILESKQRFITSVIKGDTDIMNVEESKIVSKLEEEDYYKIDECFDYLLKMHIRTFTKEKTENLGQELCKKKEEYKLIEDTSVKDMWRNDLSELEKEYPKFLKSVK